MLRFLGALGTPRLSVDNSSTISDMVSLVLEQENRTLTSYLTYLKSPDESQVSSATHPFVFKYVGDVTDNELKEIISKETPKEANKAIILLSSDSTHSRHLLNINILYSTSYSLMSTYLDSLRIDFDKTKLNNFHIQVDSNDSLDQLVRLDAESLAEVFYDYLVKRKDMYTLLTLKQELIQVERRKAEIECSMAMIQSRYP